MTVGPNEPPSESSSGSGDQPAEPAAGEDQTTPFPLFGGSGQSEPFPPFTGGQTEPFPAFTGGGQLEPNPGGGFELPPWGAPPPPGPPGGFGPPGPPQQFDPAGPPPPGAPPGQPGGFDPGGPPPPSFGPPPGPTPPYESGGQTQPLEAAGPPPPPFGPAGPQQTQPLEAAGPPPPPFDPAGPPPPSFGPAGPPPPSFGPGQPAGPPPPQGPSGPGWSHMPPGPGGPGGPGGPPPPGPYGPPGQFGPPPGGQYVPPGGPPSKKGGPAIAIVILAIVLVVGLLAGGGFLVFRVIKGRADSITSRSTSDSSETSSSSSDSPSPSPSPTPTSLWTDDGHKAEVGQCFNDSGSQTSPNLMLNSTCSPGSYKVVQRITQTTDRGRCGGDKNHSNWSVSYDDPSNDSNDAVLCLGYQYNDPAGSAIVGECVYGTSTSTTWRMSTCEPGAFQVIAKFYGTMSYDKCRDRDDYREGISYTASRSELNVVICTKYLYNDDAAYAKKNNCVKVKNEGSSWWMHFADCSKANAIVTGHTGKYQPSFCGNDGWVGYKFPDRGFKHLDYTVCWRRYP